MSQNDIAGRRFDADRSGSETTADQQVNEIRADIAQTRANMSDTIDELQDRLSPSHLKEQLKDQVREQYEHAKETVRGATIGKVEDMVERFGDSVNETRRTIVDTITANPVPSALVGIGLAWLWMNTRGASQGASRYGYGQKSRGGGRVYDYEHDTAGTYPDRGSSDLGRDRGIDRNSGTSWTRKAGETVSGAASRVQESASQLAGKARETVTGAVGQAQATASEWAGRAQYQARRLEDRFEGTMQESPLALGAVAVALGTAIGLAVPVTRKENEWMGEARDKLVDRAQSVAHDTMDQVQEVARKVTDEVAASGSSGSRGNESTT